ncbi:MAG: hypothetical protein F4X22_05680 [Gemmatimonadales bacterium]|nr:hypothetical protein [Candidatus Palauibacter denitrificans]
MMFTVGSVVAAILFGAFLGWLGGFLPMPARHAAIGAAAVLLLVRPVLFPLYHVPSSRWMVPRGWQRLGWPWYSLLFGMCLGVGVVTRVTTGTTYFVALLVTATGNPLQAGALFGIFGLARAAPLLVVSRSISRRPGHSLQEMEWLAWSRPIPELIGRVVAAFLAGVAGQLWFAPYFQNA